MDENETAQVSDLLDDQIQKVLNRKEWVHFASSSLTNEFELLLSMGELVDRLTIVNLKLYLLKDEVAETQDKEFLAWQAKEDVRLVEERARLKKCIDAKWATMLSRMLQGDPTAGINPETKHYGRGTGSG